MTNLPDLKRKSILIVEDEERNWLLLRDIVELCNGNAVWAESGMQAIDRVKEDKSICMILMDLQLPFMSGVETTRKIREFKPSIPIIAQTAYSDPELLNKCQKAGCNQYILKPINISEVYRVFDDFICSKKVSVS